MKKITLITLLVGLTLGLSAQDLNKVKDMLKDNELDKARQGIDALLAAPNNQRNVDMWYTKAKIYGAIAASEQFKTLVADGRSLWGIKSPEIDKTKATTMLDCRRLCFGI